MDNIKSISLGNARFSIITENLIRCQYSYSKTFYDNETLFAVNREYNGCKCEFLQNGNKLNIKTESINLTFIDDDCEFCADNLYGILSGSEWKFGEENKENLGGTLPTLDGVSGYCDVDNGLLARDGWFVIDDSNNPILENGWLKTDAYREKQDIYIFSYGNDYKKALRTLFYVSGKAELPRKYTFGSWYSRWWPYTDDEIIGIVDEYDKNDFPLDIMVIDMDWHHHDWTFEDNEEGRKHKAIYGYRHAGNIGWTGYSWNKNLIKDPVGMLKNLHSRNIFVTLNDHPHDGIRSHEDCYEGFMKDLGLDPASGYNPEFDISSEKYMKAFYKNAHEALENDGVDFWWVDWQQDHLKPYIKGTFIRHLPWINYCYYNHMQRDNKRGISFSRWGGFGDQKHPIYFSGDTESTWECLKFEIEFTAKSSNAGLFYWGHDTGGFFGERNPEMYARWTQFTAFSACLRSHSERSERLDRRPWLWGEEAVDSMRKSYHLRSMLMPYIYSSAFKCYDEATPLISSMYIEYPDDEKAYKIPQQYMFGEAFICAPITEPMGDDKTAKQKFSVLDGVYYNYFTNERYEKGDYEVSCPLDEFPLLVKAGTPIPMQPYTKRMTTEPLSEVIIRCFPGESGEFTLYEDDGISRDYKNDKFLKTKLEYKNEDGKIKIGIKPFGEGYNGMPEKRSYVIELMMTDKKLKIANGVCGEINYSDNINTVKIADCKIDEEVELILD